ncbi:MAG TPA: AAA family ATPase [Acidimicrobiales bacterium]|nr:AAA family ATPase [Acidimicrobiales bacterium]
MGDAGPSLLQADRTHVWFNPATPFEVDLDLQLERLHAALAADPGTDRDDQLVGALANEAVLLEDEPYADWAVRPRERLEWTRQEARLVLARDRARGRGRSAVEAVAEAWEACSYHDPTSEEAASALMRFYRAQHRAASLEATYDRYRSAMEGLGLRPSPALAELRRATTSTTPLPDTPNGPRQPALSHHREERRLVTVVFAELDSPLGGDRRLEPEELREAVSATLAMVVTHVEALGGTVTSVSGAGLVALFGAPVAHDDDPERALRATARMLGSIGGEGCLSVRAGVESGVAIVGHLMISGEAHYGAVGEVMGTAAALQSVARPASVLVGPATRAASEGVFEWGSTEEVTTAPGAKPVLASYLRRPRTRPSTQRGHRRGLAGASTTVGRTHELAVIRGILRESTGGKGAVVLITGDPGLGKTRLVFECRRHFMAWVGASSGRLPLWLEGRAASYACSTPYGLYRQLLGAWLGVVPDDNEELVRVALDKAITALFGVGAITEKSALLSVVMGVGGAGVGSTLDHLGPEDLQRATFDCVRSLLTKLIKSGPTVLVLEDLHWADPTSLQLTRDISSLVKNGPLLLVLTRRPEPDPGVSALEDSLLSDEHLNVRKLELSPLCPGAERDLANLLLGEPASEDIIAAIMHGVDGNPLFLEERFSSLLETGALAKDSSGWHVDRTISRELPEVIERLVRARVDRLDQNCHDALVAASVLGPEFGLGALRAVCDLDSLGVALSTLCSGGLLTELRKFPEPVFRFRHTLIQEATYQGLLRNQRSELHARAAWGLEQSFAGRLEEIAGVLGRHYAEAGEVERAAHFFEVSGDRAASVFANDEAIASYKLVLEALTSGKLGIGNDPTNATSALEVTAKLGDVLLRVGRLAEAREIACKWLDEMSFDDNYQAARLQVLLGLVESADHRYEPAMAAFDAADELLGPWPEERGQAVVDLWLRSQLEGRAMVHYWRNEPDKAADVLGRVRPVVETRGTPTQKQTYHHNFALQRMRETRYDIDAEMLTHARAALAAAREGGRERELSYMLLFLGFSLLWAGYLDEAQENIQASLAIVERVGDVVLRARCLCYLNVAALRRHDVKTVRSLALDALEAAKAASYPEYVAAAKATLAWVAWRDGCFEEVVLLMDDALGIWAKTVVSYSWYWLGLWPLIAVRLSAGEVGKAVEAARLLLPAPQQRLPLELESLVRAALTAWEEEAVDLAGEKLRKAVATARRLRFA